MRIKRSISVVCITLVYIAGKIVQKELWRSFLSTYCLFFAFCLFFYLENNNVFFVKICRNIILNLRLFMFRGSHYY